MEKRLVSIIVMFYSFLCVFSSPGSNYWTFETITTKNGLNNNTIYGVYSGTSNFMWFSTDVGITRYDGFRLRNFPLTNHSESGVHILSKAVKTIKKDVDGLLYMQLVQGGVICFDIVKEEYKQIQWSIPINERNIVDFYLSPQNELYLATETGLYVGKVKRQENQVTCTLSKQPAIKGNFSLVCGDGNQVIYLATADGKVQEYTVPTKKISNIELNASQTDCRITKLSIWGDYLWICRRCGDVYCYHTKQKIVRPLSEEMHIDASERLNFYVNDIVCVSDQAYYLSTLFGLYRLTFEMSDLLSSPFTMKPVRTNGSVVTKQLLKSTMRSLWWNNEQDILWIGTFGEGVMKFNLSVETYNNVDQHLDSEVNDIEEDLNGYIWLVTEKGGVWKSTIPKLSPQTVFEPWTGGGRMSGKHCLYKDPNGNLWLGGHTGEVVYINPMTQVTKVIQLEPDGESDFSATIRQFCLDSRDRLWITTSDGLIQLDMSTQKSRRILPSNELIKEGYAIAEDKEGGIWLGTTTGLRRLELVGDQVKIVGGYEERMGLDVSPVYAIYVNNYNQILVSYGNKLIKIDGRDKHKVESSFTLMDGLTNGHVYCMIDDQMGNTWLGSNSGIMTVRNDHASFYNYSLLGSCRAVCRLKDGRLLWANFRDMIFFDPVVVKSPKYKKNLALADLFVNGASVGVGDKVSDRTLLYTSPDQQKTFVFDVNDHDFSFYFSDLHYGIMERKMAYRLLPVESEWTIISMEKGVSYAHLSSGKYTLQANLIYPDGTKGEVLEVPIVVQACWWQTIWAIVLFVFILLGIGVWAYRYFIRRVRIKRIYRARELFFKEALKMNKVKEEQKKKMDEIRNRLLTLLMKELRTPLSLIIAPLKEITTEKDLSQGGMVKAQMAYRSSIAMVDICNQLLGIYTQGAAEEILEIAPYSIKKIVESILLSVKDLIVVHSIDFQYNMKVKKNAEVWISKRKIDFLIHNLISNAFLHIRYSGIITLSVCETMAENGSPYCKITVTDNGSDVIIWEEDEEEMWQRDFSCLELGMSTMKTIIQEHHGTISLDTGKGTQVEVMLPLTKDVFKDDLHVRFIQPEELEELAQDSEFNKSPGLEECTELSVDIPKEIIPHKKTLLVVEDHKEIRLYLNILLGKEYKMLMASNGQEGVELAKKELPDLIICDVMMPIKDGFECCREVKEGLDTCHIPLILLTAKVEDEDVLKGLEMGADDYMLKPFTPSILKARVKNLIAGRSNLKQMYAKLLMLPEIGSDASDDLSNTVLEDPFICSVIRIIEENLCEVDFNVKKLASDLNMSQPTLYRKVKQSTDYTIIELIRGVRIKKAALLLKEKQYSVAEVAEMVGYNDIPTFRKHFVDTFGTTPSTYVG
ncbi:response regulator [Bacteroides sp.]|uniref:hybrid sensor histidine kinase/response regulator transcription factor n=1 Tax=Bacteroides sp. TaxID=29523 RepID=UPI002FCB3201